MVCSGIAAGVFTGVGFLDFSAGDAHCRAIGTGGCKNIADGLTRDGWRSVSTDRAGSADRGVLLAQALEIIWYCVIYSSSLSFYSSCGSYYSCLSTKIESKSSSCTCDRYRLRLEKGIHASSRFFEVSCTVMPRLHETGFSGWNSILVPYFNCLAYRPGLEHACSISMRLIILS